MSTRPPFCEMQAELSARKAYSDHRDLIPYEYEGIRLDVAMNELRDKESNRAWAARQARKGKNENYKNY